MNNTSSPLKIIFAGTPEFAAPCLQALINSEHKICMVYTQPDRPSGRGRKLTASPIKNLALQHELRVSQPVNFRTEESREFLRRLQADIMIVVAYGLILPPAVLSAPRLGCINVHASLLPRWRGAAPIQRAILAGEKTTGVTIMQMDQGLDTGAMLHKIACPLYENDTAQTLHDRLATIGSEALLTTLQNIQLGTVHPTPQDDTQSCYASKLEKQEALINWQENTLTIERKIRAFNPWPIAQTVLNEQVLRIWQASILQINPTLRAPGTIISATQQGIDVATSDGILRLLQIQMSGGKPLPVADILNAKRDMFLPGQSFT